MTNKNMIKSIKNKNSIIYLLWIFAINIFSLIVLYNFVFEICNVKTEYFLELENKSSLSEIEITSYHEAGHTLMIFLYPEYFEFTKATIIPSKDTLGYCKHNIKKNNWRSEALVFFGGLSAENFLFKKKQIPKYKIGRGAGSDCDNIRSLCKKNSITPRSDYDMLYKECQELIELNEIALNKIAEQLLIKKTLFRYDIEDILKKHPLKTKKMS